MLRCCCISTTNTSSTLNQYQTVVSVRDVLLGLCMNLQLNAKSIQMPPSTTSETPIRALTPYYHRLRPSVGWSLLTLRAYRREPCRIFCSWSRSTNDRPTPSQTTPRGDPLWVLTRVRTNADAGINPGTEVSYAKLGSCHHF